MSNNYDTIEKCIQKVDKFLNSEDFKRPFLINAENKDDYFAILEKLQQRVYLIECVSGWCSQKDNVPNMELGIDTICSSEKSVLLLGFSQYLKFRGEQELCKKLSNICGRTTASKVIVLCYKSEKCFRKILKNDMRLEHQFRRVFDSSNTEIEATIIFVDTMLDIPNAVNCYNGMQELFKSIEERLGGEFYVQSKWDVADFRDSLYKLKEISSAYDVLLQFDLPILKKLSKDCGPDKNWGLLLKKVSEGSSFEEILDSEFTSGFYYAQDLGLYLKNWEELTGLKKWLYFIHAKTSINNKNRVLAEAAYNATSIENFINNLLRNILNISPNAKTFKWAYGARKELLKNSGISENYVINFCKYAEIKGNDKIYYLTDNTQYEKEEIVKCISNFKDTDAKYSDAEIKAILGLVYPDLAAYLSDYYFANPLLDNYFGEYKFQKIRNEIRPKFMELVKEHATKREYNYELPYRSEKVEIIADRENSWLYFFDALGVEFLSYIMAKCDQYRMNAKVSVCRSNLPSITSLNKEFLNEFDSSKTVANLKELDELKHEGKYDYDYQKTKYPIHITKELKIVDEVLSKANKKLLDGDCKKVVIISDHGASRLAVINEHVYDFDVDSKGTHGGRCCAYSSDIEDKVEFATIEDNYYVLASYDRFRGGRAASVETHGGATLEELVVPIIELTRKDTDIEIELVSNEIYVSFKVKADLEVYSSVHIVKPVALVNGKFYQGQVKRENIYSFVMPDIKKIGTYNVSIYDDNNSLRKDILFQVKKNIFSENDIL